MGGKARGIMVESVSGKQLVYFYLPLAPKKLLRFAIPGIVLT